jgi:hypothetical protein
MTESSNGARGARAAWVGPGPGGEFALVEHAF